MLNFDFYNPTKIVFGQDRLSELDNNIPKDARVLITYGGNSASRYGTLDKVKKALKNRVVLEFGGIEVNPRFETLKKSLDLIEVEKIDFLLAIGGGSVLDGTKFISILAKYKGSNPQELLKYGFNAVPVEDSIDVGTVLTLPATGSEMNCGSVISHKEAKYQVISPFMYPKFSFLDPTLTYTLPKKQVANGVVDAFVHTIEQYLTYPVDAKFQDRTAEGILKTLIEIGHQTVNNHKDYKARANLVWTSTMALNGLIGSGVPQDWATHMIGHELTAHFGIDHARTLAIVLPALLEVRQEQKKEKLLQYASRVWGISEGDDISRIKEAIHRTKQFFTSFDMPTTLSAYDIEKRDIEKVIAGLEKKGMHNLSETKDLTLDISRKILDKAFS